MTIGPAATPMRMLVEPVDAVTPADDGLARYRHLALTVIEQAFRDMLNGKCSLADRQSAQSFLAGCPGMHHWCRVAGLDPREVIARARRLPARELTIGHLP